MSSVASSRAFPKGSSPIADELENFRATHPLKLALINGVEWEYFDCGKGPQVLVILPGLIGIAEMSFQQIQRFEDCYRVIVPSYPDDIDELNALVQGILGLLRKEGIAQADILGGSFGGMVAQWLIRQYPEAVRNLVLSHTGGPKPERAQGNQRFIRLVNVLPIGLLRGLLRSATRKSMQVAAGQRPFWIAYSNQLIQRLDKKDLLNRYVLAIEFDTRAHFTPFDLNDWPGRILILEGDNDPIAEAPERQALKGLHPQAQTHTFHGSGHIASIVDPDGYVQVIKEFLNKGRD